MPVAEPPRLLRAPRGTHRLTGKGDLRSIWVRGRETLAQRRWRRVMAMTAAFSRPRPLSLSALCPVLRSPPPLLVLALCPVLRSPPPLAPPPGGGERTHCCLLSAPSGWSGPCP